MATPLASPPPPTGTTTLARWGTSSSSSRPSVPCPATTSGSSKGCTKAMPASRARSLAAATHSSTEVPQRCTTAPSSLQPSTFDSGASTGMKTSHGTPRARAAWASAQAWLPALPPVTPRAHESPSAASLFSAPRILNEPVRWRFSAFSATSPPARCVRVSDGSTGVSLATSALARRACPTSPAVTVALAGSVAIGERLARQGDDGVDLDRGAQRQRGDAYRAARGRALAEEAAVGLVDLGEGAHGGDVDAQADRVGQLGARGPADEAQVLQAAARLIADRALDQLAGHGVERDLARAVEHAAAAHRVAVGADGVRSAGSGDGIAMVGHASGH